MQSTEPFINAIFKNLIGALRLGCIAKIRTVIIVVSKPQARNKTANKKLPWRTKFKCNLLDIFTTKAKKKRPFFK